MSNVLRTLSLLALVSVAACDDKASTADAGYAPTKTIAAPSVRTTRLDCGGKFGTCPPGENCYIDTPGCDATGFCGPPEPTCAHTTTFCGCHGIEFACTFGLFDSFLRAAKARQEAAVPLVRRGVIFIERQSALVRLFCACPVPFVLITDKTQCRVRIGQVWIKFQRAAVSRATGTDTDAFAYGAAGVPSALISLPLRYMHTTVETVHRDDVEDVIRLITAALRSLKGNEDLRYIK